MRFISWRETLKHSLDESYGGSAYVGQGDKLGRPTVIMGAEAYDVNFSHNAPQNSRKNKGGKGQLYIAPARATRPLAASIFFRKVV
jgi:hypothetical protein